MADAAAPEKEHSKEEIDAARKTLEKEASGAHRDAPHMEALDPEKKKQVDEVAAKAQAEGLPFPTVKVMQFLVMHNWDAGKALTAMKNAHRWRTETKAESLPDGADSQLVKMCLPGALVGRDKQGRPFYIEKTGRMHALEMLSFVSKEEYIKQHSTDMMRMERVYAEESKKRGKDVYTFNFLMDLSGMSFGHRHAFWFLGLSSQIDADYFPEQVERVFLINTPWFTPGLWEMAKSFLHESISSKVVVLGWDWKKELLEFFDADQLPVEYGGSSKVNIPEYSSEQIRAYVKDNVQTPKTTEEYVGAGAALTRQVTLMEGDEVSWYFLGKDGYDVNFSVVVKGETVEELVKPERIVVHRGTYKAKGACVVTFTFDNSFSYIYGKYVNIAIEKTTASIDAKEAM